LNTISTNTTTMWIFKKMSRNLYRICLNFLLTSLKKINWNYNLKNFQVNIFNNQIFYKKHLDNLSKMIVTHDLALKLNLTDSIKVKVVFSGIKVKGKSLYILNLHKNSKYKINFNILLQKLLDYRILTKI